MMCDECYCNPHDPRCPNAPQQFDNNDEQSEEEEQCI